MRRHIGRTLLLLVVGLFAAAMGVLRSPWAGEQLCSVARRRLPALIGFEVGLGSCRLDPLRGSVEIVGFSVGIPGSETPLAAADRVLVHMRSFDVLTGRLRIERVVLDRPRVHLRLPERPAGQTQGQGCFLDVLRYVDIDAVAINAGRVGLERGARALELDEIDLDVKRRYRRYTIQASAARGAVDGGAMSLPIGRARVAGVLDRGEAEASIEQLEVTAGDLSLAARGTLTRLCDGPTADVEVSAFAPLDLVAAILGPQAPALSGSVAGTVRLQGLLVDPQADAEATLAGVRIGRYEVGDAWLEAELDSRAVRIPKLEVAAGAGRIRARAAIERKPGWPVTVSADVEQAPFGTVLGKFGLHHAFVDFTADGHAEASGTLAPFRLDGPAEIEVRDFRVYDRGWDRPSPRTILEFDHARVELQADFDARRAHLGRGRIHGARSELLADATLFFDADEGLDISAEAISLDLEELKHIAGIPWGGTVSANARVRGPYSDIAIEGRGTVHDPVFHRIWADRADLSATFARNTLAFPSLDATLGGSKFSAKGEIAFGGEQGPVARARGGFHDARLSELVDGIADVHWIFDLVRDRLEARASGEAWVEGPLSGPRASVKVAMQDATYFRRKLGNGRLDFSAADAQYIDIAPLEFDGPSGKLRFAGRLGLEGDGALDFDVEGRELSAAELIGPDAPFADPRGRFELKARLFGPPGKARFEGSLFAHELSAWGVALGGGELALHLDGPVLGIKGPIGSDLLFDGRLVIEDGVPFALGLSARTGRLEHYLPGVQGLRGSVSAELLASGSFEQFEQTRGDIWISQLAVVWGGHPIESDAPIDLGFVGTAIEARTLVLRGPEGSRVRIAGLRDGDGVLDLAVEGGFDARLVEPLLPQVDKVGGRIDLSATLSGPTARPTVLGSARITDGRFEVRALPMAARDVRGRLEFSQNKVFFADVEATVNDGRTLVSGDAELDRFAPKRYDLRLLLDEVRWRYPEDLPCVLSGELTILGPPTNLVLAGNLDANRLRYTAEMDPEDWLSERRKPQLESKSFDKSDEFARFDIDLHLPGDARLDNALVQTAFKGDLRLVGTNLRPGVIGVLRAADTGRLFFRGNEFSLTRGTVELTERDRIAPVIDVHAESQVRDYRVFVHAFGPLERLQVNLSSDPELPPSDVVTLLALGFTSRDPAAYTAEAGASLVGETLFNIAGLDRQVKHFIPKNSVIRDFSFQISTQYSEDSGLVEPMAQFESRFLSESLKLRLSQPVVSGRRGRVAQAEYRFNRHLSAQAQWDSYSSDNPFGTLGDLGLDLKLRWELD